MKAAHLFKTTRWAVVEDAHSRDDSLRLAALDSLVRDFSPALVEFVRVYYQIPEVQAEEWIQGFLADRVVARGLLKKARQEKGLFRNFLMATVKSYISDSLRSQAAKKRRPENGFVGLEKLESTPNPNEPNSTGQAIFDEAFVKLVILKTIRRTHQACFANDYQRGWAIFYERMLRPLFKDEPPKSYGELVASLALKDTSEAYNKLAFVKAIFKKELRHVITDYSLSLEEREDEIKYFRQFLK